MSPEDKALFESWGVPLPSRDAHGKDDDIATNLQKPQLTNWRLEGNVLKATSQLGEHGWTIPTDYIMTGTDENNLPIFKKIGIT